WFFQSSSDGSTKSRLSCFECFPRGEVVVVTSFDGPACEVGSSPFSGGTTVKLEFGIAVLPEMKAGRRPCGSYLLPYKAITRTSSELRHTLLKISALSVHQENGQTPAPGHPARSCRAYATGSP